jgi:EmrB/QacA subfamily drug resistance transporter
VTSSALPASARSRPRKAVNPNIIMGVLSIAGLSYSLLSAAVLPALPRLQHDLHTSATGAAWVLTAFLLAAAVATAILGRLGDMYGKEKLLLLTLVILADSTLLAAVSKSLTMLIIARVLQGVAGGVFPLSFAIVRDEFPEDRVAGSIGFLSSVLGIGSGFGIVLGGVIVEHLNWHWLFWLPLGPTALAALATWWFIPESPVRTPGRVNWLAAFLVAAGTGAFMFGLSETTVWGWGAAKSILVIGGGLVVMALWVLVEVRSDHPLVDMSMMRIRAVWTTNLAAAMIGAGMFAAFIVIPQVAQAPKSTGYGYGASVVVSGFYLLPSTIAMATLGSLAGRITKAFGSKAALLVGSMIVTVAFAFIWVQHSHPIDMYLMSGGMGFGMGLAYSAMANIIVQSVPSNQTGVAGGMNTVVRLLGGALGGQISATFIADHTAHGHLPGPTGYTMTYALSTVCLAICVLAALAVPGMRKRSPSIVPLRREFRGATTQEAA